jgi:hypothetical protein
MTPIILGCDLWVLDDGLAFPPMVTDDDPLSPRFGQPLPGMMAESFSIIKAGTRIYLKPPERRCQCPKTEHGGRKKKKRS